MKIAPGRSDDGGAPKYELAEQGAVSASFMDLQPHTRTRLDSLLEVQSHGDCGRGGASNYMAIRYVKGRAQSVQPYLHLGLGIAQCNAALLWQVSIAQENSPQSLARQPQHNGNLEQGGFVSVRENSRRMQSPRFRNRGRLSIQSSIRASSLVTFGKRRAQCSM